MKPRSFFTFLAIVVVILLSIASGILLWLIANTPLSRQTTQTATPVATIFVPSTAPAFASLLVNPEELEAYQRVVVAPQSRRFVHAYFSEIKKRLLAKTDLNYERDIQPWLGDEISLACTTIDIDRDPDNGRQPGYLLALATKNKQRSQEFLDLFWSSQALAGSDVTFETYKGATIIYNKTADNNWVATTFITSPVAGEQFVLFANHPKVLRDAINNVQVPSLSLQNSSAYQSAVQQLTQPKIALGFINIPQIAAWSGIESFLANSQGKDQIALAFSLTEGGLLAETALIADWNSTNSLVPPLLSYPVQTLKYLPTTSVLAVAGINLQQMWSEIAAGLANNDPLAQLFNQLLADIGAPWGLDLPKDIFSWVQGEYALALLPRVEAAAGEDFDWIFVAQRSPEALQGIEHLDVLAQQQGFSTGAFKLGEREIFAWTKLSAPDAAEKADSFSELTARVFGVRASVGDYDIFTSSIQAMAAALAASEVGSLSDTVNFRQAISVLPSPNYGYVYLDFKAAERIIERRFPLFKFLQASSQLIVERLRAIAITSTGSEAGVRRAELFLGLGL
ncbi:MAG: DUF3352 domain-containing protein [Oscillatoriaceae bacterium SKW80]|nr:DUF3352 domain-containing protein [Oscillatoriaceae bacterium SKYG93]MCX8120967.1 DUF3352 domain-containing protein [Oscillatoriaceae bacterium SKW80]MDW8452240.1 DUF3352 domain-containing protein [Oscillatoriaceae cyanobacterium SKYGB_i_bin93]HIK26575.1 DUF3352 domain-containing protein [Oscillatoriaceae cyanobacterium M7585_C2015_266]